MQVSAVYKMLLLVLLVGIFMLRRILDRLQFLQLKILLLFCFVLSLPTQSSNKRGEEDSGKIFSKRTIW